MSFVNMKSVASFDTCFCMQAMGERPRDSRALAGFKSASDASVAGLSPARHLPFDHARESGANRLHLIPWNLLFSMGS